MSREVSEERTDGLQGGLTPHRPLWDIDNFEFNLLKKQCVKDTLTLLRSPKSRK